MKENRSQTSPPRHCHGVVFTFETMDIMHRSFRRKRKKKVPLLLALIFAAVVGMQVAIFYQGVLFHSGDETQPDDRPLPTLHTPISEKHPKQVQQQHQVSSITTRSDTLQNGVNPSTAFLPRVLIGIIGNANSHMGKVYRWRHRQLISLWNDTRVCSLYEFEKDPHTKAHCQIVYSFVVGAHNATSTVPPFLLDQSRPMTVGKEVIPLMPRYKDIHSTDVTLLNIRENMNEGKTPTFFYWASQVAQKHGISYVMKCDSDALLRLGPLFLALHKSLPWPVRPTLLGAFRHKAYWNQSTTKRDEQFWNAEYYAGMHLYLAGQLYLTSVDLANVLVEQARQNQTSFCEGHEDHDATSMIDAATAEMPVRWLELPRHHRFWEHPVKGEFWWKRIWKRESKKASAGKKAPQFPVTTGAPNRNTLMVIIGTQSTKERSEYRRRLLDQASICELSKSSADPHCRIRYVFVVTIHKEDRGADVLDNNADSLVVDNSKNDTEMENDVVVLNVPRNENEMGQSILLWIEHNVVDYEDHHNFVLFCRSDFYVKATQWLDIVKIQGSGHHLLIGDVRDKYQMPREFPNVGNESHWYHELENIHLYLGGDCFALSTSLLSGMLEVARSGEARQYWEGDLGHDMSALAHHIQKTILQWVPIGKTLRFWYSMDHVV